MFIFRFLTPIICWKFPVYTLKFSHKVSLSAPIIYFNFKFSHSSFHFDVFTFQTSIIYPNFPVPNFVSYFRVSTLSFPVMFLNSNFQGSALNFLHSSFQVEVFAFKFNYLLQISLPNFGFPLSNPIIYFKFPVYSWKNHSSAVVSPIFGGFWQNLAN